ncbi:MAG: hypothetical protein H8E82_05570 [Candidatus Marinimicrobia bacterium]|nr:hypothetical protein [Candidatus Neomarinimicrobiota bacterium]
MLKNIYKNRFFLLLSIGFVLGGCASRLMVKETYKDGNLTKFYYKKSIIGSTVVREVTFHPNGLRAEETWYKSGRHIVRRINWDTQGQLRQEQFYKKGVPDGKWTWWNESGIPDSQKVYKKASVVKYTRWYPNGQRRVVKSYRKSLPHGIWRWWGEDAIPDSLKMYQFGQLDGNVIIWHENGGLKTKQFYRRDSREGRWTWWNKEGIPDSQKVYREELVVKYTRWHPNGKRWFVKSYKDELLHGEWIWWGEDAVSDSQKVYKNGKLDGMVRHWYSRDQLRKEEEYHLGKRDGRLRKWYEHGPLEREEHYKQGIIHGTCKYWLGTGVKYLEVPYVNGQKQGILKKYYYATGRLQSETEYEKGEKYGHQITWNPSGRLIRDYIFISDEPYIEKEFYSTGNHKRVKVYLVGDRGWEILWDKHNRRVEKEDRWRSDHRVITKTHKNGMRSLEIDYEEEKKHGVEFHYYENGALQKEVLYYFDTPLLERELNREGELIVERLYQDGSIVWIRKK